MNETVFPIYLNGSYQSMFFIGLYYQFTNIVVRVFTIHKLRVMI